MLRFFASAAVMLIAANGSVSASGDQPAAEATHAVPYLHAGNHLGIIRGFNAKNPPRVQHAIDAGWAEAVEKGMRIARVQIDWAGLEPAAQKYDKETLKDLLTTFKNQGLNTFLTLSTIDSEDYTLPADLMKPGKPYQLKDGKAFDDPAILERFHKLLDWVVPLAVEHGVWGIAVGNEPGTRLDDHPEELQPIVNFVKSARDHAFKLDPNLPITITMRQEEVDHKHAYVAPILAECDIACFNYYCVGGADAATVEHQERARIDALLAATGAKPIVIQELGCSAGYEGRKSSIPFTPAIQKEFFEFITRTIRNEPRLRAAFVFQLVDWSPKMTRPYKRAGMPKDFTRRLIESLETVGLFRFNDGTPRPAWAAFLDGIANTGK